MCQLAEICSLDSVVQTLSCDVDAGCDAVGDDDYKLRYAAVSGQSSRHQNDNASQSGSPYSAAKYVDASLIALCSTCEFRSPALSVIFHFEFACCTLSLDAFSALTLCLCPPSSSLV